MVYEGYGSITFDKISEAPLRPKRERILGVAGVGKPERTVDASTNKQQTNNVAALCVCLNDLINATKLCGG